ncbi:MAG: hypothetical protein HY424_02595 [Candidatus Levybacteria bacterium]|nr:hypothetical protein [Candidatus Levybacteria bacterium]
MLTKNDLQQIRGVIKEENNPMQKELKKHGKLLRSLKKDQNTMLGMLDKEQMQQRKRLKRVEDNLGLAPIS